MKHYIIVKFTQEAVNSFDKQVLFNDITDLFAQASAVKGVHSVSTHSSVIDLPNRYDMMIIIEMDREALGSFDASFVHERWKQEYGDLVASKTIFDTNL